MQLLKERVSTLVELADAAVLFYRYLEPSAELVAQHLSPEAIPALTTLANNFMVVEWKRQTIQETLKAVVAEAGLKMPKIAMPLRVLVTGETQTPSIDATLELLGRETVLCRLQEQLAKLSA